MAETITRYCPNCGLKTELHFDSINQFCQNCKQHQFDVSAKSILTEIGDLSEKLDDQRTSSTSNSSLDLFLIAAIILAFVGYYFFPGTILWLISGIILIFTRGYRFLSSKDRNLSLKIIAETELRIETLYKFLEKANFEMDYTEKEYNSHTKRILLRMFNAIENFENEKSSLQSLVDFLEGSLNAIEEKFPETFYSDWFSNWGNLEIAWAFMNNDNLSEPPFDVSSDCEKLKELIWPYIDGFEDEDESEI